MTAKGLVLNSGGIDSPVAAYVMARYGLKTVHFTMEPYSTGTARIAENVISHLNEILKREIPTVTVPYGQVLSEFLKTSKTDERKYTCIFCKRMMFRTAERIAHREGCNFLITGENLGQVASQTLQNIFVASKAVSLPIVRPLIGLDKLDIITIAEQIGTYNISIEMITHCDAVPTYPAIRASLQKIEAIEKHIDIEGLIQEALGQTQSRNVGIEAIEEKDKFIRKEHVGDLHE